MDAQQNLYKMQQQLVDVFKAQDPDTGYFDVVFEIEGKKLYAHRFRLSGISPTLNSMLSDRWNSNKDEPVKITNYKFEDFKGFLIFIYSGECVITDENIYDLLDMAEFYGVKVFKNACEKYLSNIEVTIQNVFRFLDLVDKYSIPRLQESLKPFVSKYFTHLTQTEMFQNAGKSNIKNIVEAVNNTVLPEKLFEEVFKWAEHRAIRKQKVDRNVILNDVIKAELTDILPLINFQRMDYEFLAQLLATKSYLFSSNELNNILANAERRIHVKAIDGNGKTMKGYLDCPDMDKVFEVMQSLEDVLSKGFFWETAQQKPSQPSKLSKNDEIEWYLVYDCDGDLALKQSYKIKGSDYLLAEMFTENGFELDSRCKIAVHRFL